MLLADSDPSQPRSASVVFARLSSSEHLTRMRSSCVFEFVRAHVADLLPKSFSISALLLSRSHHVVNPPNARDNKETGKENATEQRKLKEEWGQFSQ